MSRQAWAAFECSALAGQARIPDQAARLFNVGYELGRLFIEAVERNEVQDTDIFSTSPYGFTAQMQGPSADFMLGRIWVKASENALRDIYSANFDLWQMKAETTFRSRNCEYL